MRRPRALPPGGPVGIVSPSSPVKGSLLDAGIAVLESRGFRVRVAPHARDRAGHHAGTPADRAADFIVFYADPQIDVIWCARGGSSACRLWPLLNWDYLATLPPKLVVGYSDTTSLLIPFIQRVGTIALHGPFVFELGTLAPALLDWQLRLMQNTEPAGLVPALAAETLVSGTATGLLCGGCLSLVTATLGTPHQIDTAGKLLLIEDIGEAPHRIERYLVQLAGAGLLQAAVGFVVGEATDADETDALPVRQLWSEMLAPYGKPTVLGFPFGHVPNNYALPLGVQARLDAGTKTLTLLEAAVA